MLPIAPDVIMTAPARWPRPFWKSVLVTRILQMCSTLAVNVLGHVSVATHYTGLYMAQHQACEFAHVHVSTGWAVYTMSRIRTERPQ